MSMISCTSKMPPKSRYWLRGSLFSDLMTMLSTSLKSVRSSRAVAWAKCYCNWVNCTIYDCLDSVNSFYCLTSLSISASRGMFSIVMSKMALRSDPVSSAPAIIPCRNVNTYTKVTKSRAMRQANKNYTAEWMSVSGHTSCLRLASLT